MHHTIEFVEGGPAGVVITTGGAASLEGFARMNGDLLADPRFRPGMRIVVDHSQLDATSLTRDKIDEIRRSVEQLDDRLGDSSVAIVVPDAFTFDLARMSVPLEDEVRLRVHIFVNREDALAWLWEQPRLA